MNIVNEATSHRLDIPLIHIWILDTCATNDYQADKPTLVWTFLMEPPNLIKTIMRNFVFFFCFHPYIDLFSSYAHFWPLFWRLLFYVFFSDMHTEFLFLINDFYLKFIFCVK
jgi:hypothetical protein